MLNRLPSDLPSFRELANDIGLKTSDTRAIARALGVSERTIWTWWASDSPRPARLALWWLSRWGHNMWDVEMANRTQLAVATNRILWASFKEFARHELAGKDLRATYGRPPANEPSCGPLCGLDGMKA